MRRSYNRLSGEAADHDQLRVRREARRRLRRAVAVRDVRALVEHGADPGGGIRAACFAERQAGTSSRCSAVGGVAAAVLVPLIVFVSATVPRLRPVGDGRLAPVLPAEMEAEVPPDCTFRAALAAPSGVAVQTLRRRNTHEDVAPAGSRDRPVLLATLDVPYADEAIAFAVDSAVENGQPLVLVNAAEVLPTAYSFSATATSRGRIYRTRC